MSGNIADKLAIIAKKLEQKASEAEMRGNHTASLSISSSVNDLESAIKVLHEQEDKLMLLNMRLVEERKTTEICKSVEKMDSELENLVKDLKIVTDMLELKSAEMKHKANENAANTLHNAANTVSRGYQCIEEFCIALQDNQQLQHFKDELLGHFSFLEEEDSMKRLEKARMLLTNVFDAGFGSCESEEKWIWCTQQLKRNFVNISEGSAEQSIETEQTCKNSKFDALQTAYDELQNKHSALQIQHDELHTTYCELIVAHDQLSLQLRNTDDHPADTAVAVQENESHVFPQLQRALMLSEELTGHLEKAKDDNVSVQMQIIDYKDVISVISRDYVKYLKDSEDDWESLDEKSHSKVPEISQLLELRNKYEKFVTQRESERKLFLKDLRDQLIAANFSSDTTETNVPAVCVSESGRSPDVQELRAILTETFESIAEQSEQFKVMQADNQSLDAQYQTLRQENKNLLLNVSQQRQQTELLNDVCETMKNRYQMTYEDNRSKAEKNSNKEIVYAEKIASYAAENHELSADLQVIKNDFEKYRKRSHAALRKVEKRCEALHTLQIENESLMSKCSALENRLADTQHKNNTLLEQIKLHSDQLSCQEEDFNMQLIAEKERSAENMAIIANLYKEMQLLHDLKKISDQEIRDLLDTSKQHLRKACDYLQMRMEDERSQFSELQSKERLLHTMQLKSVSNENSRLPERLYKVFEDLEAETNFEKDGPSVEDQLLAKIETHYRSLRIDLEGKDKTIRNLYDELECCKQQISQSVSKDQSCDMILQQHPEISTQTRSERQQMPGEEEQFCSESGNSKEKVIVNKSLTTSLRKKLQEIGLRRSSRCKELQSEYEDTANTIQKSLDEYAMHFRDASESSKTAQEDNETVIQKLCAAKTVEAITHLDAQYSKSQMSLDHQCQYEDAYMLKSGIIVKAGATFCLPIVCSNVGARVLWKFSIKEEESDIGFSVSFHPIDPVDTAESDNMFVAPCRVSELNGQFDIAAPMTINFEWNNTFSWLNVKSLDYYVVVRELQSPNQQLYQMKLLGLRQFCNCLDEHITALKKEQKQKMQLQIALKSIQTLEEDKDQFLDDWRTLRKKIAEKKRFVHEQLEILKQLLNAYLVEADETENDCTKLMHAWENLIHHRDDANTYLLLSESSPLKTMLQSTLRNKEAALMAIEELAYRHDQ